MLEDFEKIKKLKAEKESFYDAMKEMEEKIHQAERDGELSVPRILRVYYEEYRLKYRQKEAQLIDLQNAIRKKEEKMKPIQNRGYLNEIEIKEEIDRVELKLEKLLGIETEYGIEYSDTGDIVDRSDYLRVQNQIIKLEKELDGLYSQYLNSDSADITKPRGRIEKMQQRKTKQNGEGMEDFDYAFSLIKREVDNMYGGSAEILDYGIEFQQPDSSGKTKYTWWVKIEFFLDPNKDIDYPLYEDVGPHEKTIKGTGTINQYGGGGITILNSFKNTKPISRRLNMKKFVVNGNGFDWVEKKSFQARKDAWQGRQGRQEKKDYDLRYLKSRGSYGGMYLENYTKRELEKLLRESTDHASQVVGQIRKLENDIRMANNISEVERLEKILLDRKLLLEEIREEVQRVGDEIQRRHRF